MKLKKLEITGFKSFNETEVIDFPAGISAIVGPNGCGKSNIVDALRWVMGEQSLKQLRGKKREDIIFSGANGKPPLNMAEVNLTLVNDNGSAPEELQEFSEIMLTRRLYRSGESAYLLNKQPCRLKDIYNVFLGSGMGSKSYAVIQQGNIGLITEAGPEERRVFLEEAAGTTRYNARKTEAVRKIESTKQNLLRINDITSEIKRHMNSLRRQAKKAERYQKYRSRLRELDITLGFHEYDTLTEKIREIAALLEGLKDTDTAQTTRLKKVDAAIEDIKLKSSRKSEAIAAKKAHIFEMRRTADKTENDLAHAESEIRRLDHETTELESARETLEHKIAEMSREVEAAEKQEIDLKEELAGMQAAMDSEDAASREVRSRLSELKLDYDQRKSDFMELATREARYKNIYQNTASNKESVQRRLKRKEEEALLARKRVDTCQQKTAQATELQRDIQKELHELNKQVETGKASLDEQSRLLSNRVKTTGTLEFEKTKLVSKRAALEKMRDNFEWYKDGVKAVMQAFDPRKNAAKPIEEAGDDTQTTPHRKTPIIAGLMADVIDPQPSYEAAVEAVLGERLQYVLVQTPEDGKAAIAYLQNNDAGRGGFIPISSVRAISRQTGFSPDASVRLLNHLSVRTGFEGIAEALLGDVMVVDTLSEAVDYFTRKEKRLTIVTKSGNLLSPHGIMVGGSKEKLSGILSKKKELKDIETRIGTLEADLERARAIQKETETVVLSSEKELQRLVTLRQQTSRREIEAEKASYKAGEDLKNARRHLEIVELEQEQLMGEALDMDDEMVKFTRALARISEEIEAAQDHITATAKKIETVTTRLKHFDQKRVDLQLKHTSLSARLENSGNSLKRLKDFQVDADTRLKQLMKEVTAKKARKARLEEHIITCKSSLSRVYAELKDLETSLEQDQSDYREFGGWLQENESIISAIRDQKEAISQKMRLLELDRSRYSVKQEHIAHRFSERYHASLSALRREHEKALAERNAVAELPREQLRDEIARYQKRIEKIGDINIGAITEYEELKQRYDFFIAQRNDLENAIENLKKVIRKINRITQKRFLETYAAVNEKLKEVFPRLFTGGTAKLVLTDPDNPLETGVEFMIQPPGKKSVRITLLSGGEKALSAIAFIFSIFLIKPASFCLLDEIDAPLDEVNTYRFNELMKLVGEKSQVVMITHNKRSMEFADTLFGVTMEKKGISKVVSVNFDTGQEVARA